MCPTIIDGSVLEGGGQVLRNAVALAVLLRKPITIEKIRNGRNPPGLKNQHRVGLQLAAEIASASLDGLNNRSTSITFAPGDVSVPGYYSADAVTAGAATLMFQISLPILLFSPEVAPTDPTFLTLKGGTNAIAAPQIDYTEHVFLPFMQMHFGINPVGLKVVRRGYFPKGGGEVAVTIPPLLSGQKLKSFSLLERGKVRAIRGIAHFSRLPGSVGREMALGAEKRLRKAGYRKPQEPRGVYGHEGGVGGCLIDIQNIREKDSVSVAGGSGIVVWAELEGGGFIGGSAVGRKGVDPGHVGEEAAEHLVRGLEGGGCIDEWLQDQIIIFMALANGISEVRTAIWLAETLTDAKFIIEEHPTGTIIRCEGIGYSAPYKAPSKES